MLKKLFYNILLPVVLLVYFSVYVLAYPIPDTGQTNCYNDGVTAIDCPKEGEPFYGQDAHYTINPPSYTKLDKNGEPLEDQSVEWSDDDPKKQWAMIEDNVTGLIWEVKQNKDGTPDYSNHHDADNTYTWYNDDASVNGGNPGTQGDDGEKTFDTQQFITALKSETIEGFTDWRLPTPNELSTLIYRGIPEFFIDTTYFSNTINMKYWTSDTYIYVPQSAWYIDFGGDVIISPLPKKLSYYVRAVRDKIPKGDRFKLNPDLLTITDTFTGLMWVKSTDVNSYKWKDALYYCQELSVGDYTDWRMPTSNELLSLVDYTKNFPCIDNIFHVVMNKPYWSATSSNTQSGSYAFAIDFNYGFCLSKYKLYTNQVRAVRGGQKRLSGNLVILEPRQGDIWKMGETMEIKWENPATPPTKVKIYISYDGGKNYIFLNEIGEVVNSEKTKTVSWKVNGFISESDPYQNPTSYNCMLNIIDATKEPSLEKGVNQGFFSIIDDTSPYIEKIIGPDQPPKDQNQEPTEDYAKTIQIVFSEAMKKDVETAFLIKGSLKENYEGGSFEYNPDTHTLLFVLPENQYFEKTETISIEPRTEGIREDLAGNALDVDNRKMSIGIVSGRVVTSFTGNENIGINGASVVLKDGESEYPTKTSVNGNFNFTDIPESENYEIEIIHENFQSFTMDSVVFSTNDPIKFNMKLPECLSICGEDKKLTLQDAIYILQRIVGIRDDDQ